MRSLRAYTLLFIVLSFVSCKKNETPAGTAFVRVIHGVPDLNAMEVKFNGSVVATINSYALSSTYISTKSGTITIEVKGSSASTALSTVSINAAANSYNTVVFADVSSSVKASQTVDDPTPASGKAKINVLHLANTQGNAGFSLSNGTSIATSRAFNDQQSVAGVAAYTNVDPGAVTMEARAPFTTGSVGVITTSTQTLQAGKSYTYIFRNPVAPSTTPAFTFIAN
jgi:RecJ-like exonuclease